MKDIDPLPLRKPSSFRRRDIDRLPNRVARDILGIQKHQEFGRAISRVMTQLEQIPDISSKPVAEAEKQARIEASIRAADNVTDIRAKLPTEHVTNHTTDRFPLSGVRIIYQPPPEKRQAVN